MPAISCPQCGAPTRVSVFSAEAMTCASCRYAGPPPGPVQQGLRAAAEALRTVDAKRLQLGWVQERIGAGARSGGGVGCLFAVLVLPFAGCGGVLFTASVTGRASDVTYAAFYLGPALFMLLMGLLITRELKKTRSRLEIACAATPPAVVGAPPGCHVCGADLAAVDLSRQTVVRCRYCAADNVVRADVLAVAATRGVQAAEGLISEVQAQAAKLAVHRKRSSILLLALTLVAPASSVAGVVAAVAVSPQEEPRELFVLVETPEGACIGKVKKREGGKTVSFSPSSPARAHDGIPLEKGAPTFQAKDLVGRELHNKRRRGRVVSVSRDAFVGTERATLSDDRDSPLWFEDLCLDTPAEGLEVVPLPSR